MPIPTNSSANMFLGHNYFFLIDDDKSHTKVKDYPERVIHVGSFYGEFFFNFVFAATAATITSGALAERVRLSAYFFYNILLTGFVQPVTVRAQHSFFKNLQVRITSSTKSTLDMVKWVPPLPKQSFWFTRDSLLS